MCALAVNIRVTNMKRLECQVEMRNVEPETPPPCGSRSRKWSVHRYSPVASVYSGQCVCVL